LVRSGVLECPCLKTRIGTATPGGEPVPVDLSPVRGRHLHNPRVDDWSGVEEYLRQARILASWRVDRGANNSPSYDLLLEGGVSAICKPSDEGTTGEQGVKNEVAAWALARGRGPRHASVSVNSDYVSKPPRSNSATAALGMTMRPPIRTARSWRRCTSSYAAPREMPSSFAASSTLSVSGNVAAESSPGAAGTCWGAPTASRAEAPGRRLGRPQPRRDPDRLGRRPLGPPRHCDVSAMCGYPTLAPASGGRQAFRPERLPPRRPRVCQPMVSSMKARRRSQKVRSSGARISAAQ
jgi:hypothetical protein